jgi:hypothetical protein
MERQDDRPRAYPDREAGRREEGPPEEGPAAADAAQEYSDAGKDREGRDYVDPSGEYSEAGRDESVETTPTSEIERRRQAGPEDYAGSERPADAEGPRRPESASGAAAETRGERKDYRAEEPRGYTGSEGAATTSTPEQEEATAQAPTEGQAFAEPTGQATGTGTSESQAAYEAATERKAVTPPDSEGGSSDEAASAAAEQSRGDQASAGTQTTPGAVTLVEQTAVLSREDAQTFQGRWETIQATFIDDPHAATEQADELVGEVMERLAELRQEYLRQLRSAIGDGSDTEAMRVALQRYRAFFQMLLG